MTREILEAGLPALGVDPGCIPELEKFSAMLLEKNRVMNLTAITEPRQVATLHLLDSLAVLRGRTLTEKPSSTWAPARASPACPWPSPGGTSR